MAGNRRSIHVEGVQHGAPIPMGAVVGNMLFSSGITGIDPATGNVPESLERQCELASANMKTLVENAGGTLEDIGSVKVYLKDRSQREAVNRPWLAMFPDPEDRPARHAGTSSDLGGATLMQCQIVAVLPK